MELNCIVAKMTYTIYILSKYYAEHFLNSTLRVQSSRSKSIKVVRNCYLTLHSSGALSVSN